jgi:hypothetical protein
MTTEGVPAPLHRQVTHDHLDGSQDAPPEVEATDLLELTVALSESFLSVEESVAELRRAAGDADLEQLRRSLDHLASGDPRGAERARALLDATLPARPDHVVAFYEHETFLVDSVVGFSLDGLRNDETVIVFATAEHREAFEAGFAAAGHDVAESRRLGRYVDLDAVQTLAMLVEDGQLDVPLYHRAVGEMLDGATRGGRKVRVYGEMVALLWEQGHIGTALELEERWNRIAARTPFPVLCSYPMRSFDTEESAGHFRAVCERHTAVTTESYALLATGDAEPGSLVVLERDEAGGRRSAPPGPG